MASSDLLSFLDLHPFVRTTLQDKIRGTFVGSALGDTVGLYTEFLPRTQAEQHAPVTLWPPPITPLVGDNHRDRFRAGSWTDDTDHALLVLFSYLHHKAVLPLDFALRLHSWRCQGLRCLDRLPLGVGQTVATVLMQPNFLSDPTAASKSIWEKSLRHVAANGSLMRTHTLGVICLGMTEEETFKIAMELSLVTHYDPRCVVSCVADTALIRGILRGEIQSSADVDALLETAFKWTQENHPDANDETLSRAEYERHISPSVITSLAALELDDSRKMGYVYKALGTGVWALRQAISGDAPFHNLIWDITLQGGDADTNACVAGALVGCWQGWGRLPPCWRDGLCDRSWLLSKVESLMITIGVASGSYDGKQDSDTELFGGRGMLGEEELKKREQAVVETMLLKMDARRREREGPSGIWGMLKRR